MSTTVLNPSTLRRETARPFWQRVWAALESYGQQRAAAELRRMAILHVSADPAFSDRLLALADATRQADRR
jgi:hypothetical protein